MYSILASVFTALALMSIVVGWWAFKISLGETGKSKTFLIVFSFICDLLCVALSFIAGACATMI